MELQNWFVEIWNFLFYVIIVIEGYCNLFESNISIIIIVFVIIIIIIIIIIIKWS